MMRKAILAMVGVALLGASPATAVAQEKISYVEAVNCAGILVLRAWLAEADGQSPDDYYDEGAVWFNLAVLKARDPSEVEDKVIARASELSNIFGNNAERIRPQMYRFMLDCEKAKYRSPEEFEAARP
ncbi:hypothetical protein [Citromicrobium bathyomarinum]|uniref:hypothetical protein n=1 Tax=Citromicrobium bathyomarinum TaxID=72174 RepID=UPI00315A0139